MNEKLNCPDCGKELVAHAIAGLDVKGKAVWSYRCPSCDKVFKKEEAKQVPEKKRR